MCNLGFCIFAAVLVTVVHAKGVPSYIKTCSLKDPNFAKCAVESGNLALPSVAKGDKHYAIPSLSPLKIPKVVIDSGSNGIKLELDNVVVSGLDQMTVVDFKVHPKENTMEIHFNTDRVEILSDYKASGKILIIPLSGTGKSNITAVGCKFIYYYKYNLTPKGDKIYALPAGKDFKFDLQRAYFDFENLIGGDLGTQILQFLNENWKEVLEDLGGALTQTISAVAESVFSGYFKKVPFKDLIPDA